MTLSSQHIILLEQSFALLCKIPQAELEIEFMNRWSALGGEPIHFCPKNVGMVRKFMFGLAYVFPRLKNWDEMNEELSNIFDLEPVVAGNCDWCTAWMAMSEQLLSFNWNFAVKDAWTAFFTLLINASKYNLDRKKNPNDILFNT